MSINDMVVQYNYSEGSDNNSNFSRNLNKDPLLFGMEPSTDLVEASLVEEYPPPPQRSSLKRKNERTDFPSSSKIRAISEGHSSLYTSSSSQHLTTGTGSETERKSESTNPSTSKSSSGKKKKNELTLEWLEENYMLCDGVCLARCILYSHYRDFCEKNRLEPSCAATFGKTIRQKFPKVTTRRLGTRGHSKYHYYGIGIRETSIYYNSVYAGKGLTRYSPKIKTEEEVTASKEKSYRFLEEVPNIKQFNWETGSEIVVDNMEIFLNVYKRFCGDILEAAHVMDFKLLTSNLLQLWSDLPFEQFSSFIHNSIVMDLVSYCDVVLYEALLDAVLPIPCDEIDERHLIEIGNAVKQWDEYLKTSLPNPPSALVGKKRILAQHFAQIMLRHVSFIKLYRNSTTEIYYCFANEQRQILDAKVFTNFTKKVTTAVNIYFASSSQKPGVSSPISAGDLYDAVRTIFSNLTTFLPMRNDLEKISLQNSIGTQSLYASGNEENKDTSINTELLKELKDLLKKNPNVEILVEWLDSVVDAKVIKPSKQNGRSMKKRAQEFMLKWSFFGARITHNLNNTSATSFNSFQYLRMFLVEYVMLAIETQFNGEKHQEIRRTVAKHLKNQKLSQHSTGSRIRQNLWPMKHPTYSHTGHHNLSEENNNHSGTLKRWEAYGCWHTNPGYDTTAMPDLAVPPHFYTQYEAQSTAFHCPFPTQSYPSISYAPLTYPTSQHEEQNEFYHKREVVVNDDESYGSITAKSETYPTITYVEDHSCGYQRGPDYIHAFGNQSKEALSKFELSESKYSIETSSCLGYSDHYLKVPSSHLNRSPNVSPFSTKMELSPAASATSPMSSHSSFLFPQKHKDENFKDNVYLIQDLSNSYQAQGQNNFKELPGNPAPKMDYKLQQAEYRIGDDLCSSAPSTVSGYSSPFAYNDFGCFDSASESNQHCLQTHNDNALIWNGSSPIAYLEKTSPYSSKPSHHGAFQENLPSISSVLSTE